MVDSTSIVADRLLQKGRGIVETCLEMDSIKCIAGFVDFQLAKGAEYVPVVEALADYIAQETERSKGDTRRTELLNSISAYITSELATMHLDERLTLLS